MILVDTAVWIDHLHRHDDTLARILSANEVLVHPLVVTELALGSLAQREEVLRHLQRMPQAARATDREVLALIDARGLSGRGLSAVDAHLLASTLLTPGARIWTRGRRLAEAARERGVEWSP